MSPSADTALSESTAPSNGAFTMSTDGPLAVDADVHLEVDQAVVWGQLRPGDFDGSEREQQRRLWSEHAADEYRAMVTFSGLVLDLVETRASLETIACASRLIRDEARHVALCLRVATALSAPGASVVRPDDVVRSILTHREPGIDAARRRVAETMLTGLYVAETASLYIIRTARKRERHPILRAVMGLILKDESFHSRLGAEWLAKHWAEQPEAVHKAAPGALATAFGRLRRGMPPFLVEAIDEAATSTILPTLEKLGLPARDAWDAALSSG